MSLNSASDAELSRASRRGRPIDHFARVLRLDASEKRPPAMIDRSPLNIPSLIWASSPAPRRAPDESSRPTQHENVRDGAPASVVRAPSPAATVRASLPCGLDGGWIWSAVRRECFRVSWEWGGRGSHRLEYSIPQPRRWLSGDASRCRTAADVLAVCGDRAPSACAQCVLVPLRVRFHRHDRFWYSFAQPARTAAHLGVVSRATVQLRLRSREGDSLPAILLRRPAQLELKVLNMAGDGGAGHVPSPIRGRLGRTQAVIVLRVEPGDGR